MSAAEPARVCGPDDDNVVVPLQWSGPGRSHPRPGRARSTPAADTPSPQQQLAETLEALYLKQGRTLSDDDTAQAFTIALDSVTLMLSGALTQGVISDSEHAQLHAMIEGMREAPQLL